MSDIGQKRTLIYVAGKAMKRHGKLVGVNLSSRRDHADAARDALFARAGGCS